MSFVHYECLKDVFKTFCVYKNFFMYHVWWRNNGLITKTRWLPKHLSERLKQDKPFDDDALFLKCFEKQNDKQHSFVFEQTWELWEEG